MDRVFKIKILEMVQLTLSKTRAGGAHDGVKDKIIHSEEAKELRSQVDHPYGWGNLHT